MAERHGRDLTRAEWLTVVAAILDGRTVMLRRMGQDGGAGEVHSVQVGQVAFMMVWHPLGGVITTVLGDDMTSPVKGKALGRIRRNFLKGGGWSRGKRRPVRVVWE